MKKYNSPIRELEIVMSSDIITSSQFKLFSVENQGNLDEGEKVDRVDW